MRDSALCVDCVDCAYRFGSSNLRHRKFYWLNQQLNERKWKERWQEFLDATRAKKDTMMQEAIEHNKKTIKRYAFLQMAENSTGDTIRNVKDCINCFDGYEAEKISDCFRFLRLKDASRVAYGGLESDLSYECLAINRSHNTIAQMHSSIDTDCAYIDYCDDCFNCLGCIGLRRKKFCILNKQYSEQDYFVLRSKIVAQMKERGEWGEFYPASMSPFGYNESLACEYFPLTRDEAIKKGLKWQDELSGSYNKETLLHTQIPDHIKDVNDSICKEILACKITGQNYKIIKQELNFYKKFNLPIPLEHPYVRMTRRLASRTPRHLWHRQCMCSLNSHGHHADGVRCLNEFETTYAPERLEKVFCEQCYLQEVV
jgi:hypothetical protein